MVRQEDIEYMRRAMELAERGVGFTNPNPMVGAVIVKNGKVIGEGWHERYGEWHAERNAFKNCAGSCGGSHDVRDVGTLLPLWKDPTLYRGYH